MEKIKWFQEVIISARSSFFGFRRGFDFEDERLNELNVLVIELEGSLEFALVLAGWSGGGAGHHDQGGRIGILGDGRDFG